MTTTNVEILRQGWLDAASALAPGLEKLPELLENGLEAAVLDERLDEQSLLRVVTDVTSAAADSLPAEELYFLTRRLQRAVYEYLLSLDALPEPPPRREGSNGHAAPEDTSLIGAEEVAALGRSSTVKAAPAPTKPVEPAEPARPAPEPAAEASPSPAPQPAPQRRAEPEPEAAASKPVAPAAEPKAREAADETKPGAAAGEPRPGAAEAAPVEPAPEPSAQTVAPAPAEPEVADRPAPSLDHPTRPAFTLFRRTGAAGQRGGAAEAVPANGHEPGTPVEAATPATPAPNGTSEPHDEAAAGDAEPFVAPRDGFHLSDLADFAVVQRTAPAEDAAEPRAASPMPALDETPAPVDSTAVPADRAQTTPVEFIPSAPAAAAARGWRLRDDETDQAQEPGDGSDTDDNRFETDPEVVEARLEINDRLRRRRCDEAAALLQRLANDVGGRALADLALDAGDRCRALGKNNAALSCYLAASRADPVHETPLLRLADICIDDHDIDLAVSYLERVTRLRRLRNDDKGALKLYRKIVTIAPYRDDILAMLMRAQANGRFDE